MSGLEIFVVIIFFILLLSILSLAGYVLRFDRDSRTKKMVSSFWEVERLVKKVDTKAIKEVLELGDQNKKLIESIDRKNTYTINHILNRIKDKEPKHNGPLRKCDLEPYMTFRSLVKSVEHIAGTGEPGVAIAKLIAFRDDMYSFLKDHAMWEELEQYIGFQMRKLEALEKENESEKKSTTID